VGTENIAADSGLNNRHAFHLGKGGSDSAPLHHVETIHRKLSPALAASIAQICGQSAQISFHTAAATTFAMWRSAEAQGPIYAVHPLPGLQSGLIIAFAADLIDQGFDAYYGGAGKGHAQRKSGKSNRTAPSLIHWSKRMADHLLAQILPSILGDTDASAGPCMIEAEAQHIDLFGAEQVILSLSADVELAGTLYPKAVSLLYPAALFAAVAETGQHPAMVGAAPSPSPSGAASADWHAALAAGLGDVHLPLRSVLARPLLSVGQLFALQKGDILPIPVPRAVPLLVNDVRFAHGAIGDSGGQAAFRIDALCSLQDSTSQSDFLEI
jgi:flagellar motor switch protein FliM